MIIDSFRDEYDFLSNFYYCFVIYNDAAYKTSEHLYQALKTTDMNWRERVRKADTPVKAKRLGRQLPLRSNFDNVKIQLMHTVLKAKFTQNSHMKQALLDTKDSQLIEGNYWHDNFWGNCTCQRCENIKGRNELGKLLMKVRETL